MRSAKNPEANLKLHYKKSLEVAIVISLLLVLVVFHGMPDIDAGPRNIEAKAIEIKVEDIPQTEQIKQAPPPARPSIPVPTENEEVPEDLTIESTELNLDWSQLPPPPPMNEDDNIEGGYVFIPFDEAPVPIGGMAAIHQNLRYPSIARKAGFEGSVVVGVLIDDKGNPIKTQILKDSGSRFGFEEAAQEAVMSVKWKPAKQRDKPVKVWVSIPIRFKLKDSGLKGTT